MKAPARYWNRFVRWFDRSFSSGWGRQVLFISGLLLVFFILWTSIMFLNADKARVSDEERAAAAIRRTVELIIDPGTFMGSDETGFPVFLQFLITMTGAVIFTAMLITVLGNIISNRIDDFKKGRVRYRFDDHILVLGANSMLVNMLKEFVQTGIHEGKKIVVLTTQDTLELHDRIVSYIPGLQDVLDITFLNGSRVVEQTLENVQVGEAHSIYILGEDNEIDHDSVNLQSWDLVRKLCSEVTGTKQCYLVVDRMSTYHVLQYGKKPVDTHLYLNIIHSLENWAQRVLVSREYQFDGIEGNLCSEAGRYPAIDRKGIDRNSSKTVRFVIYGMTQMSYAMASTVAHIAHYPNFVKDRSKKTKICFVAPDIREEMDYFLGHYDNLFQLSKATCFSKKDEKSPLVASPVRTPRADLGDFLDIEWEFIDASIESAQFRDHLTQWAMNDDEYLTLAICNNESDANMAAALYLPEIIYVKDIPVFVYQPLSGEVLKYAHGTGRYSNVYPFGMKDECYDPMFRKRIVKAKRINYIYDAENFGRLYCGMGAPEEVESKWNSLDQYVYRFSNLYAANSIPTKMRSIGIDPDAIDADMMLTEAQVDLLSVVEHNRWNMERLLLGIYAIPIDERNAINHLLKSGKKEEEELGKSMARLVKHNNRHKDITPYDDLPERSKNYDRAIVRNILDVIRNV